MPVQILVDNAREFALCQDKCKRGSLTVHCITRTLAQTLTWRVSCSVGDKPRILAGVLYFDKPLGTEYRC